MKPQVQVVKVNVQQMICTSIEDVRGDAYVSMGGDGDLEYSADARSYDCWE